MIKSILKIGLSFFVFIAVAAFTFALLAPWQFAEFLMWVLSIIEKLRP